MQGRKSVFKDEYVEQARRLSTAGATISQMATFFEVHVDTVYDWMNRLPEFASAIKSNRKKGNKRVVMSLYERATGYYYDEEEFEKIAGQMVLTKVNRKHKPADVNACKYWLSNRDRENWKLNGAEVEVNPDEKVTEIRITRLTKTNDEIKKADGPKIKE